MSDDRPSIAELQRLLNSDEDAIDALLSAAPVLLEIAAAALALFSMDVDEDSDEASIGIMLVEKRRLCAAISKVAP